MSDILLADLLHLGDEDFKNAKIKFNQWNGNDDPMDLYQNDPEIVNTQWLFWKAERRYFYKGQIAICFLKLSWDTWLLTTIKKIKKELGVNNGINYEGYELNEYKQYYGRVIVKYHKTFQTQGIYLSRISDELVVNQILPAVFDGEDFPGYDKVRLSYKSLYNIVTNNKRDWINALENQKAVYLITDVSNGKLYVGSATSDTGMLLQRWRNYVDNGHGGNKELKKLVEKKSFDYIKKNFQYSILENFNAKVDDKMILERESWWKETLQSRTHGYNAN